MRLRFTIRDLLWLTVVVALSVALWREHRQFVQLRQQFKMQVVQAEIMRDAILENNRRILEKASAQIAL